MFSATPQAGHVWAARVRPAGERQRWAAGRLDHAGRPQHLGHRFVPNAAATVLFAGIGVGSFFRSPDPFYSVALSAFTNTISRRSRRTASTASRSPRAGSINFASPIPEPDNYALMLGGLGVLGRLRVGAGPERCVSEEAARGAIRRRFLLSPRASCAASLTRCLPRPPRLHTASSPPERCDLTTS